MKLTIFKTPDADHPLFGIVLKDQFVLSFTTIIQKANLSVSLLESMEQYLAHLPESQDIAQRLQQYAHDHFDQFEQGEIFPIQQVRLLPPIPKVPALLDFGLSPRHLLNAGVNLIDRECKWPLRLPLKKLLQSRLSKEFQTPNFRYYKCNHHAMIGDGDTIQWPSFTSFLDIEPELGIVIGQGGRIAGYLIFNDGSARDVQWPDFLGLTGPAKCKDFDASKGIGPFLVTPDEVQDPLCLDVEVRIGDRLLWRGSTSEYTAHPEEVVKEVRSIFTPVPGTILGMGTIPDCCSLETEEWLLPGDKIEMTFTHLGTLTQYVSSQIEIRERSRWGEQPDLSQSCFFY